ncbi:MAG: hypothetical protein Q8R55_06660 [Candidatus Taylorbacteria bacterium]|nr:hypothetical protein [Candidatus Taylorbacteria bacterium]
MMKNIFKPTKKKILKAILLALAMSFFSVWVGNRMPVKSSIFFVFFGILNAGYLIFQLLLTPIFRKILLQSHSISTTFAYMVLLLPLIGQVFYVYILLSIRDYFKNRNKNTQAQDNSSVDNNQPKLYPMPSMQEHALSLTKEIAQMKVLRSPGFLVPIVVLSVILGSTWLYAQKSGKPTIKWSQKEVVEIVLPSTTKNVPVLFRSGVNLNNVTFFITPGLRNVVSVNPSQFPAISAGNNYSLTLTINSGNQSQVKFEGTVHLRDNLNYATNALPLPVQVVVHNELVPPDPGEAGKQTLEGIDSDNDGVRDDIQRWIVLNYLDSEKRRAALRQYTKINEAFLVDANDKELSRTHSHDMERASTCAYYVFDFDDAVRAKDEIRAQLLNTETRSRAYLKADSQLGGTFSLVIEDDEYKAQCTFDPDVMSN